MNTLLLHPTTKLELEQLTQDLSAINLVVGPHGIGKTTAIKNLIISREPHSAARIQNGTWEGLIHIEQPDETSLGIDSVKELESLIRLHSSNSRYLIVSAAERLTFEAQNAFLKTLEDSPKNTYIFLLVPSESSLLPTIKSRAQLLTFFAPPRADFYSWLQEEHGTTPDQARELYYTTEANAGTAQSILTDKQSSQKHEQRVSDAKEFLQRDAATKLKILEDYSKEKQDFDELLQYILRVCRSALWVTAQGGAGEKALPWSKRIELVESAQQLRIENVNLRLIIADLVLNWS